MLTRAASGRHKNSSKSANPLRQEGDHSELEIGTSFCFRVQFRITWIVFHEFIEKKSDCL